jgi:hypothetical protein
VTIWPEIPEYGDGSYTREEWLLDTNPTRLRHEYTIWKHLATVAYIEAPHLQCWQSEIPGIVDAVAVIRRER